MLNGIFPLEFALRNVWPKSSSKRTLLGFFNCLDSNDSDEFCVDETRVMRTKLYFLVSIIIDVAVI